MRDLLQTWATWLFLAAVAAGALLWGYRFQGVSQPAPFNHKAHVVGLGMACEACHDGARESARATIPNVRLCALCHVPGKKTPRTPRSLEKHIRNMKEIRWKTVYEAPPHVRFSHERHVRMAGLECQRCHGDLAKTEKAVARQAVPLTMGNCMECHRKEKVSTDCLTCHR